MGPTERLEEAAIEESIDHEWVDDYNRAYADDLEHDYVSESEMERYWREQDDREIGLL